MAAEIFRFLTTSVNQGILDIGGLIVEASNVDERSACGVADLS
jgi:hypothetical protein